MIIKTLDKGKARDAMNEWRTLNPDLTRTDIDYKLPELDENLMQVRYDLQKLHNDVRSAVGNYKTDYQVDYRFGIELYDYLRKQAGFSVRIAADDGFWRYLSLKVIPDVVAQRWPEKKNDSKSSLDTHYWSQPRRVWLQSIWWFVHLSWQGDSEKTREVLSCKHFTTDTVQNFVERPGKYGTHIEVYREIISYYSKVHEDLIKRTARKKEMGSDDLFRIVMKLNTAKMLIMDPALCTGGVQGYVERLFADAVGGFDPAQTKISGSPVSLKKIQLWRRHK